jgi:alpha-beta hydrolase superfamily lysophospholipase
MTTETTTATPLEFAARDGLLVRADWYEADDCRAVAILCHRSHFNRAEYRETAPRLNALGISCLALDQRSGMATHGVRNETYDRAKAGGLATGYLAARPDLEAAAARAADCRPDTPLLVVGSSYSASLALLIAAQRTAPVTAVAAFSPGEHLKGIHLADELRALELPVFATAARSEIDGLRDLLALAPPQQVTVHEPTADRAHGSRSLWARIPGSGEYWAAFIGFLDAVAPPRVPRPPAPTTPVEVNRPLGPCCEAEPEAGDQ